MVGPLELFALGELARGVGKGLTERQRRKELEAQIAERKLQQQKEEERIQQRREQEERQFTQRQKEFEAQQRGAAEQRQLRAQESLFGLLQKQQPKEKVQRETAQDKQLLKTAGKFLENPDKLTAEQVPIFNLISQRLGLDIIAKPKQKHIVERGVDVFLPKFFERDPGVEFIPSNPNISQGPTTLKTSTISPTTSELREATDDELRQALNQARQALNKSSTDQSQEVLNLARNILSRQGLRE